MSGDLAQPLGAQDNGLGVSQGMGVRRLTPLECARLQGFPDDFIIPVSDTQAYRQFGNSVVVPAIQATAEKILHTLTEYQNGGARDIKLTLFN